jgi:hypothetical protein
LKALGAGLGWCGPPQRIESAALSPHLLTWALDAKLPAGTTPWFARASADCILAAASGVIGVGLPGSSRQHILAYTWALNGAVRGALHSVVRSAFLLGSAPYHWIAILITQ